MLDGIDFMCGLKKFVQTEEDYTECAEPVTISFSEFGLDDEAGRVLVYRKRIKK